MVLVVTRVNVCACVSEFVRMCPSARVRHVRVLLAFMVTSSSSFDNAGQRLTPHSRTLEVKPGRINKKLFPNLN